MLQSIIKVSGLSFVEYSDDRGDLWMEIRPPSVTSFRVPFYGYRTHLMRLVIDHNLSYWLEVLGHCVRNGTFQSLTSGGIDPTLVKPLIDLLSGGATVCQGRGSVLKRVHQFHPKVAFEQGMASQNYFTLPDYRYRSFDCLRLIDSRSGATQCSACLKTSQLPNQQQLESINISPGLRSGRQQHHDSQYRNTSQLNHDHQQPQPNQQPQQQQQQSRSPQTHQHQHSVPSSHSINEPLNLSIHHPIPGLARPPRELKTLNLGYFPQQQQQLVVSDCPSNVTTQTQQPNQYHHHHHHHYTCGGSPVVALLDQNPEDYRLAKEAAFLSLSNDRDHSVYKDCFESTPPISHTKLRQVQAEPLQLGRSEDGAFYDAEFHSSWIKQEMFDSPSSNPS